MSDVRTCQYMRPPLVNDCYYHVYNRGVLKQPIFFDETDYVRFVHDLYEFNDIRPAPRFRRPTSENREQLVAILSWCLMPNHFHLFLQQRREGGISLFLKKLGGGYTKYINEKYEWSGHAFQGKYQVKIIQNDAYFLHLSRYIHLNPMDLAPPGFSSDNFLSGYRWSSYLDWTGSKNFPSLIDIPRMKAMRQMGEIEYKKFVDNWRTSNVGILI